MSKIKALPPQDFLIKILDYNKETGELIWKQTKSKAIKGNVAGYLRQCAHGSVYRMIRINGVGYSAHRLAWRIVTGQDPGALQIDHIDGNSTNNSWSNLRLASNAENQRNKGIFRNNKSGFKGVHKHGNRWKALIYFNKKKINLGCFDTPELAHMAYCKAAAELHGEFARGQ